MENLISSINAVVPIFLILFLGYLLRKKNITDEVTIQKLNKIVYILALPLFLFRDISTADIRGIIDPKLIFFAVASTVLSFALIWIGAEIFIKEKRSIGAFVQGAFRSNYSLIGLSLASSIGGSDAIITGSLVTASVIPFYNILSIIVLTLRSGEDAKIDFKSILSKIIRNPLIIAIFLAIPFSLLRIKLPVVFYKTIDYIGSIATPVAMISIGGTISFKNLKNKKIFLAICAALIKIAILPILVVPIATYFGFKGNPLLVLYIMAGSPTAVSSYIMACNLNADSELASNIFIISTILSVFTFTMGVFILKTLQLIG